MFDDKLCPCVLLLLLCNQVGNFQTFEAAFKGRGVATVCLEQVKAKDMNRG